MTMCKTIASAVLVFAIALAPPSHAAGAVSVDPESTAVSELVVVAQAQGPAWWKASKGDSVVWILGLPPSKTTRGMKWDDRTLERRLKGARLMLAPAAAEPGGFGGKSPPLLPRPLAERASAVTLQLNQRPSPAHLAEWALLATLEQGQPKPVDEIDIVTVMVMLLRFDLGNSLNNYTRDKIYSAAKRAGVPIVRPAPRKNNWDAAEFSSDDPAVAECATAMLDYVETPTERFGATGAAWAVGDVRKMLAVSPKGLDYACRRFWSGSWERTIDFQTKAIAEALEQPGKVIAVARTTHLVAEDGILVRLRAQGYTIADPAKRLTE